MNVIIANKYKDALSNLNIDVIKRLDGEFDIDTIIDTFANFYFNRMIIDITAIRDSFNIANIQRLSASLDASKIILFLSDDPRYNNVFLSKVISLGIYNFTSDITGVSYLMNNPNSYRDVAQYHDLAISDNRSSSAPRNFSDSFNSNNVGNDSNNKNYNSNNNNNNFNTSKTNPFGVGGGFAPNMSEPVVEDNSFKAPEKSFQPWMGPSFKNNNVDYNNNNNNFNNNSNSNNNYDSYNNNSNNNFSYNEPAKQNTKIIGFKDLTDDAGATTLIYMLKKNLASRKVLAVEMNKNDFSYFNDNEMMSVGSGQLGNLRNRFSQFEIVLIDLNNSNLEYDGTCSEVIYLLEPSIIKLNTLMRRDRQALEKLKDKKIVLNKSLLSNMDVKEFEYEAKVKMFYNIPPLDDRKDSHEELKSFLEELGIFGNNSSGGLFGMFKK